MYIEIYDKDKGKMALMATTEVKHVDVTTDGNVRCNVQNWEYVGTVTFTPQELAAILVFLLKK